ncbi:zinc-binding dehydrogenase [Thermoflexus sp.]|uniref:zinc-binding dehydrogenase n=1 Tax=Thermoflexus sp. TaxID=1969742 RepID=UPI0035E466A3
MIIGIGGLGRIVLQVLRALSSARLIAVGISESARQLARELGADDVLAGGPDLVAEVRERTKGGAHVVLDFVGEAGVEQQGWQMLRSGDHPIAAFGGCGSPSGAHPARKPSVKRKDLSQRSFLPMKSQPD